MEHSLTENLILLEFLVEDVYFATDYLPDSETLVAFQFLDNESLLITEDEFKAQKRQDFLDTVRFGKSCLFSMTSTEVVLALKEFDIHVGVFKKTVGRLYQKSKIGDCLVSISNLFKELMNDTNVDGSSPAKVLNDYFSFENFNGETVGDVKLFIRLSSFGKLIVTHFTLDLENKSIVFMPKSGSCLFKQKTNGDGDAKTTRKRKSAKKLTNFERGDWKSSTTSLLDLQEAVLTKSIYSIVEEDYAVTNMRSASTPVMKTRSPERTKKLKSNTLAQMLSKRVPLTVPARPPTPAMSQPCTPQPPPNTPAVTRLPSAPFGFIETIQEETPEDLIETIIIDLGNNQELKLSRPYENPKCVSCKTIGIQYCTEDTPRGYLEGFYGKEVLERLERAQLRQERELEELVTGSRRCGRKRRARKGADGKGGERKKARKAKDKGEK